MKQKEKVAYTPEYVESLEEKQVFVFGSNLVGCHSGGAALLAVRAFGAVWGQAEGPQGRCYAIPVDIRGESVGNVSTYMKRHIDKFLAYAKAHRESFFLVPRIGCGAAGFDEEFIASFFKDALDMENVSLPKSFVNILTDEEKDEEDMKRDGTQRVFNLIILDESGSMTTIAKQAVNGLNETFLTIETAQKEHEEQQHFISLVAFNSARIRKIMDIVAVGKSGQLRWTNYNPGACTPLFDAMGRSLNELRQHVTDEDVVLVTIITDGYENASREYCGHDIKRLVADLKAQGWVFAYIGTNQDVDVVADDMGIHSRMSYDYSPEGANDMFENERRSRSFFFSKLSHEGKQFIMADDFDYFNVDEGSEKEHTEDELKDPKGFWSRIKGKITG